VAKAAIESQIGSFAFRAHEEGLFRGPGRARFPRSISYLTGEPHGIRKPSEAIAKYVVFEMHGSQKALEAALPNPPSLMAKLTDPQRWKG
jgi:hypothetical protein